MPSRCNTLLTTITVGVILVITTPTNPHAHNPLMAAPGASAMNACARILFPVLCRNFQLPAQTSRPNHIIGMVIFLLWT